MNRAATQVVAQLCQNKDWRNKVFNGTDEEWLELTNQFIKSCELDPCPTNVRELLWHLGPKVTTQQSQSKPILSFYKKFREME